MRNDLEPFFKPRHIIVIDANTSEIGVGGISHLQKLQESNFRGKLYRIAPTATQIGGVSTFANLSSLPLIPDLAVVCVPAPRVPTILEECARIGLRYVNILTSGFNESGTEYGRQLEEQIAFIAKKKGLLIIGPNCIGPYCPSSGLTAWGPIPNVSGPLGVISQNGSIMKSLIQFAYSLGIGIEKAVSIGNGPVLSTLDFLEFMGQVEDIRIIALYVETMAEGRRFFELAKKISKKKPIVIWKSGNTKVRIHPTTFQKDGIAGEQSIWEAAFRQAGVIQVNSLDEWMDAILAFAFLPPPLNKGVFLIGGGGGPSVVSSDTCIDEGLDVPSLSSAIIEKISEKVPAVGSIAGNPLDDWQSVVNPAHLGAILDIILPEPNLGMVIVNRLIPRKAFHSPSPPDSIPATIEQVKQRDNHKPVVFVVDSEGGDPELARQGATFRAKLSKAGIPAYRSLNRAARSLMHLFRYHSRLGRAPDLPTI